MRHAHAFFRLFIICRSLLGAFVETGLSIGIAISEFAGKLADAVLVAMAAGTFIYVGATEVIAEEFESPHDKWKKFFALSGTICTLPMPIFAAAAAAAAVAAAVATAAAGSVLLESV